MANRKGCLVALHVCGPFGFLNGGDATQFRPLREGTKKRGRLRVVNDRAIVPTFDEGAAIFVAGYMVTITSTNTRGVAS